MIYVCALSAVEHHARRLEPSHLISLLSPDMGVPTPHPVSPDNHLRVAVHDISTPIDGHVHPADSHVEEIITFIEGWPRQAPLLIHCHMGISRSTATAYTALCMINGAGHEDRAARLMRELGPHVQPNRLIVQLADKALGREGRMLRAIEAIGPGMINGEGPLLKLPLSVDDAA
jgi:predicted protein tyrosine phosphatase